MAEAIEDSDEVGAGTPPPRRRIWRRVLLAALLVLVAAGIYAWTQRKEIAGNLITGELNKLGLEAKYRIVSIGPRREIVADIVVGDPARPDLTVERAEFSIVPRFPFFAIGQLKLVKPRLYGTYVDGKLSFGSLDPLLFKRPSAKPFELPDIDLVLDDGRALLESDYGAVGFKAEGAGNLRSGFAGILAADAPALGYGDCRASRSTLYGKVSIASEQPHFVGPLRVGALDCPQQRLALRDAAVELDTTIDRGLDGFDGKAGLAGGALALGGNRAAGVKGTVRLAWRDKALNAQYKLSLHGIVTPQLALADLTLDGSARARDGFAQAEAEANISGSGLRPGGALDTQLHEAADAASGTLAGPMLVQIRQALASEGAGSSLDADVTLRKTDDALSLVVPQANLRGRSGQTLLALSRVQATSNGTGALRFAGNFTTGGPGLPRIWGRMEDSGGAAESRLRISMAEYHVGEGTLELPQLLVSLAPGGAVTIYGTAIASGPLPGGSAKNLRLPLAGSWSSRAGLTLWPSCVPVDFDRLAIASLALDKRRIVLCPPTGGAIVRSDGRGTRIAAGAPSLELTGKLGATPVRLKTGAVGLAWPGSLSAKDVDVALGPADRATRFRLKEIGARIGGETAGTFAGADALLFAVPLDILDASGTWRFAGGRLELSNGTFRLQDRARPARFAPLIARDATLALADNKIAAAALLREPKSDRGVVQANIEHDLNSGTGHADLDVPGIAFDDQLQPDTLTDLALGVVADAKGTVTGKGRIDWDAKRVTSSGRFSTQGLDFAAAFGPVQGVSGTVEFTDLLGLVTAPNQRLHIASFNPGIAVEGGDLTFALRPNFVLAVDGGNWPFLGGTLTLEPTTVNMAATEARRFTLKIDGMDAALFVQRMDLANFSATGIFDGELPLVFDQNGGRIENGYLRSRPPGGNLSYVGDLTYKDLSTMANFAFQSLKDLNFKSMDITLGGPLTGEIVTNVKFDGISQGEHASKNFLTRRIAKLPIRFNVNITAPFYRLITSFKAIYDPAYVKDPRDLGLVDANGKPIDHSAAPAAAATKPEDLPSDEAHIQP